MKQKRLFLCLSIGALALSVIATAIAFTSKQKSLVNATTPTDYRQTLAFNASNITSGSGSVTVNGNTFNYTDITVSGANLVFGVGSKLVFSAESGDSISAEGMIGGSFKSIGFTSVGTADFTYTFNSVAGLVTQADDGETIEQAINTPYFDIQVTAGSFTTPELRIKYDCVAPVASHNVLIVGSTDVCNVTDSSAHPDIWVANSYTSIMDALGSTATYTFQSIPTHTLAVLADATSTGGARLRNALNDGVYDSIVIQIPRRITPSGTEVIASELAALASIKTLLHSETDDIYMMAPWTAANPTIFGPGESGTDIITYVSTGTKETKTISEMANFYADLADQMATIVEGKPMYLSTPFAEYAGKYTFKNASKHLLFGYVLYSTFFNRIVPVTCSYTDGNSSTAVKGIRDATIKYCVHPEIL